MEYLFAANSALKTSLHNKLQNLISSKIQTSLFITSSSSLHCQVLLQWVVLAYLLKWVSVSLNSTPNSMPQYSEHYSPFLMLSRTPGLRILYLSLNLPIFFFHFGCPWCTSTTNNLCSSECAFCCSWTDCFCLSHQLSDLPLAIS